MNLPNEEAGRKQVQAAFGAQLRKMGQLLRLAFVVVGEGRLRIGKPRGADATVPRVVTGLFAKACKTYRGIVLLCEAGLAEDAFILARGLFETTLAVFWVLQRASRRRAQMYVVHLAMRDRKLLQELQKTRGLKRYARVGQMRALDAQVASLCEGLTPQQTLRLADKYSGLSILDTAKAVRLLQLYQLFYRHASSFSHGSDLSSHLSLTSEGQAVLHVEPRPSANLKRAMGMSYAFFLALLGKLNDRLGLGHDADIATTPRNIS